MEDTFHSANKFHLTIMEYGSTFSIEICLDITFLGDKTEVEMFKNVQAYASSKFSTQDIKIPNET